LVGFVLLYEQEELAEMKYQAFLEEAGLANWEECGCSPD
jgi:hypothetical protein